MSLNIISFDSMMFFKILGLGCLLIFPTQIESQKLVILCTASLIPVRFEERKNEYIEVLSQLRGLKIPFYVVENHLASGPSFLNDYCDNVLYVACNNMSMRNKGVNEAFSMVKALDSLELDGQDMVIKLTGRYSFRHFNLLKLIEANNNYDVFVKYDFCGQVYTGCYAMRYHYMKKMVNQMDLARMESEMISIETVVADFVSRQVNSEKVHVVEDLGIMARFFGDGSQINSMEL